jgi:hypothetical protein
MIRGSPSLTAVIFGKTCSEVRDLASPSIASHRLFCSRSAASVIRISASREE